MKRIALVIVSCFALIMPGIAFAQDDAAVAVADDAEESDLPTCFVDLNRHVSNVGSRGHRIEKWSDVDDRQVGCGAHNW